MADLSQFTPAGPAPDTSYAVKRAAIASNPYLTDKQRYQQTMSMIAAPETPQVNTSGGLDLQNQVAADTASRGGDYIKVDPSAGFAAPTLTQSNTMPETASTTVH